MDRLVATGTKLDEPFRPLMEGAPVQRTTIIGLGLLALLGCTPATAADLSTTIASMTEPAQGAYTFLHEHPELGKKEFKAQTYLEDALKQFGFTEFIASTEAPTAVIAILDSGRPGPTIALRAEMDARPLERNAVEPTSHMPRSQIDGLMHNCGHDIHASILLGTAGILIANKERFSGKIVFLFQPAEETPGGADDIVHEKILERLGVKAIFAEHVAPGMPIGTIGIAPDFALAGSNYFHLKIKGRGSHAAAPNEGSDTPLVAARMAIELSEYPARHLDIANKPVVISVTQFLADGNAGNVIPADADVSGTIRSFENISLGENGEPSLEQKLDLLVSRMASEAGVNYDWAVRPGAPATRNDPALFEQIIAPLGRTWPGMLDTHPGRGMFSEDFSYYTGVMPALYFSIGVSKDGRGLAGVHTKEFDAHPDIFAHGLRLMTTLAVIGTAGKMDWQ
ncbi:M20 family metallopeptidase [Bradyrhizobium sp. B097]|uniref:M20 metallopeptidase family protein n=1 Tax=Bradyrhizobium sp. B097 TaxID=3140244 RepID=UPI003183AF3E